MTEQSGARPEPAVEPAVEPVVEPGVETVPRPRTLVASLTLVVAHMVVMGVATAATWFYRDDLRTAWYEAFAAQQGLPVEGVMEESSVVAPSFFPVALTMYVTYLALMAVLVAMARHGARWARYSLTGCILVFLVVEWRSGFDIDLPLAMDVLSWLSVALHAAALVLLWLPANNAFFRSAHNGRWARVAGDEPLARSVPPTE